MEELYTILILPEKHDSCVGKLTHSEEAEKLHGSCGKGSARQKGDYTHHSTTPIPESTPENRGLISQDSTSVFPQAAFTVGLVTATKGSTQKLVLYRDGAAVKDESHKLAIHAGTFQNITADGLSGLKAIIEGLKPNQALTLGTAAENREYRLLTKKALEVAIAHGAADGAIARTKELITKPEEQYLIVLDHDREPGKPSLDAAEFWQKLTGLVPELADAARLVTTSTSSGIYHRETGKCLRPADGHHTYLVVSGDVERLVELIKVRGWANGTSFYKLGESNQKTGVAAKLERHLLDTSVFSFERLVYEAGACFEPDSPLEQRRAAPELFDGSTVDLDCLPAPTPAEQAAAAQTSRLLLQLSAANNLRQLLRRSQQKATSSQR